MPIEIQIEDEIQERETKKPNICQRCVSIKNNYTIRQKKTTTKLMMIKESRKI